MFGRRAEIREHLLDLIEKFRQKGAISPEKAMTVEELGLPSKFEEAMKRRLGRLGIFVEVNGKYYLSEERWRQLDELRSARGEARNPRKIMMTLRLVQLVTLAIAVTLMLVNLFFQRWELRIVAAAFMVVWVLLLILQIYYLSRVRRRVI